MEITLQDMGYNHPKDIPGHILKTMPHDKYYWQCGIKDCIRCSIVLDYGTAPLYLFHGRKWINPSHQFYLCSRHWKEFRPTIKKNHCPPNIVYRPQVLTRQQMEALKKVPS